MYDLCRCGRAEARYERLTGGRPEWVCGLCWREADEAARRARRLREITQTKRKP